MRPGDNFLGVLDLFGILLPGAVFVAVLYPEIGAGVQSLLPCDMADRQNAGALFVAAYIAGHLAYLLGSFADRYVYDPIRQWRRPYSKFPLYRAATRVSHGGGA